MTPMRFGPTVALFSVVSLTVAVGCSSTAPTKSASPDPTGDSGAFQPTVDAGASGAACDPTFGSAQYYVDFEATWSQATHPMAFVTDAHLTPLAGGSHNESLIVWRVGETATRGVQAVAETGDPHLLSLELEAAVKAGTAWGTVRGSGISPPPGKDRVLIDVDTAHPLVSLETMLAPSPDWFAGVDSVNLCSSIGWTYGLTVQAHVYDAGTKSGEALDYSGSPTKDPIKLRDQGIFAGNTLIGSFHFVRKL